MAGDRIRLGAHVGNRLSSVGHLESALRVADNSGVYTLREAQILHVVIMSNGQIDARWPFGPSNSSVKGRNPVP